MLVLATIVWYDTQDFWICQICPLTQYRWCDKQAQGAGQWRENAIRSPATDPADSPVHQGCTKLSRPSMAGEIVPMAST
jgi:hypothetical protein